MNQNTRFLPGAIIVGFACMIALPLVKPLMRTGKIALNAIVLRCSNNFAASPPQLQSSSMQDLIPSTTPWASVGGCGAGGSGGGGGGAKWVSRVRLGAISELQATYGFTFGQNFYNQSLAPHISYKLREETSIGLAVPLTSKIAEVQPTTLFPPQYFITGGMGDIGLDISQSFGMIGEYSLGLSLALPTGQYNIKRGSDKSTIFLPTGLQKGTGLYNASLTLSYNKDVEDGIWMFDLSYSNPFNMKPFSGENQYLDEYFALYKNEKNNKRFYYRFKPYGENDLGDYVPPSATISVYYGNKKTDGFMHSFGVTYSMPLAEAWIHSETFADTNTLFEPRPDPDHKVWSASFNYGMEVSTHTFPLFFGVSLPFHSCKKPAKSTDPNQYAPDMKDFLQQWTFNIGVKSILF
jgi:hypothetical protein